VEEAALTNRELAALIILGALIAFVLRRPQRGELKSSLRGVLDAFLVPAIVVPLLLYALWTTAAVAGASKIGLWDSGLLKTTILWFLLSGLVLLMNLNHAIQKPGFFKQTLLKTLGIAALLEFLSALKSFPLWLEIPGQSLAVMFAMIAVVAERDPKHTPVRKLANGYLVTFGFAAVIWSVTHLIRDWSVHNYERLVGELLLPIWLTPVALVFVYWFAIYAAYQGSFLRMRIWNRNRRLLKQRLAMALRAHVRLGYLRHLSGLGAQRIARASTFREAWREVGALRKEARERAAEGATAKQRLIDNAGLVGSDESGQQLDQREFEGTRKALRWLATCHMGHYRNHGDAYRPDLLPIVEPHFSSDGLPDDHGIGMYVSSDGQSWYATRQTITGWWFAIGAAGPPPDQWHYDGPAPPQGLPLGSAWDQFGGGPASVNWD